MSTFDGLVTEFPEIRIDYFRVHPDKRPPSACFLSHTHSDHLQGLESLKMPFVYCSIATKKIMLRMEKYPHRINFQKDILEARRQTYKHLTKILRPLPLHTPIELELSPKTTIRVTLFDANHCPGAVMFLIEGNGKAILYTGDVRAEPWWVNSIVRNPILLPYSCGLKRLDCLYLDTTFASHNDIYKEFPTKAEGLKELSNKMNECPKDSIFYFRAWTLGYEDVWIVMSSILGTRVHVDDYQLRLFSPLAEENIDQGPSLTGCQVGNSIQPGCLTAEKTARIHSCEPGMDCHAQLSKNPNVVWVTPIISRLKDGTEVAEIGAGGGGGDLYQVPELELGGESVLQALELFCASMIEEKAKLDRIQEAIKASRIKDSFKMSLEGLGLNQDQEVSLKEFVTLVSSRRRTPVTSDQPKNATGRTQKVIHFPYSRHSSFSELKHLVSAFRPRDICPCTIDISTWSENVSMEALFGDQCSGKSFQHDKMTRHAAEQWRQTRNLNGDNKRKRAVQDSQETASPGFSSDLLYESAQASLQQLPRDLCDIADNAAGHDKRVIEPIELGDDDNDEHISPDEDGSDRMSDVSVSIHAFHSQDTEMMIPQQDSHSAGPSITRSDTTCRKSHRSARLTAYKAAKSCLMDSDYNSWDNLGLRSVGWKGHTEEEIVL